MSVLTNLFSSVIKKRETRAVGIDIGSSSIKVVELEDRRGVLTLMTYGELQLGPYVGDPLGQSVVLEASQEQTALVDVIRESAVKAKSAVFAMPLSASFVTNAVITARKDADIEPMVRLEARKVIPASLSELTLDYAELEPVTSGTGEVPREVLIAAIKNDALKRFKVLMQFAGLTEPLNEIECFSTIRALFTDTEPNLAIIDIGAVSSKLYLAKNGQLMRMHRIRAGGALATKRIMQVLDVSFEEAELAKRDIANHAQAADIKRAYQTSLERAFVEFAQVIQEYERTSGITIPHVYLSGGGALFSGVTQQLASTLERPVLAANPFARVAYPAFMEDALKELGPSFTVALGAALRQYE